MNGPKYFVQSLRKLIVLKVIFIKFSLEKYQVFKLTRSIFLYLNTSISAFKKNILKESIILGVRWSFRTGEFYIKARIFLNVKINGWALTKYNSSVHITGYTKLKSV